MRDMALPHLTSVTAWRPVQGSTTCSHEPGQHLFPMLLSSRTFGVLFRVSDRRRHAGGCAWYTLPASEDSASHAALRIAGQGHQGIRAAHRAWRVSMRAARMMTLSPALREPPAQHPGWGSPPFCLFTNHR